MIYVAYFSDNTKQKITTQDDQLRLKRMLTPGTIYIESEHVRLFNTSNGFIALNKYFGGGINEIH